DLVFDRGRPIDVFPFGSTIYKTFYLVHRAVVCRYMESLALHVENEVLTHYGDANNAYIRFFLHILFLFCPKVILSLAGKKQKGKNVVHMDNSKQKAQQKGHEDEHEKQYRNVCIGRPRGRYGSLVVIGHQRRAQANGPRERWHT